MSHCHQKCANHYRHTVTEHFIRQLSPENRRDIHQRTVSTEQFICVIIVVLKLVSEIQDQQCTHAIKTEVFPYLQRDDVINRARLRCLFIHYFLEVNASRRKERAV